MTEDDSEGTPAAQLLRDFVNTREPQVDTDALGEPAALRAWFEGRGLVPARAKISARHLQQAIDVREGLRALFLAHAGHGTDPGPVARLNDVLIEFPVRLSIDSDGYLLAPSSTDPLAGPLASVADAIRQCHEDGTWPRLKACARDTCRWAFYDASRNKVRRWCSMAGCGNHVKMKRAYARRTHQA